MRRLKMLVLTVMLVFSITACGKEDTSLKNEETGGEIVSDKEDSSATENENTGDYISYDDLTRTETLYVWPDDGDSFGYAIDCPDVLFDSYGWGIGSEDSTDYSIVVAHQERPVLNSGMSLEEAFLDVLNGEDAYHAILRSVFLASYGEVEPEMETVTLDSGQEAIRFSGMQSQYDYGYDEECPIYGYCVFCGNAPVIVSYIVLDPDEVDEDTVDMLADYVDRMVNTIRIVE